MRSRISDPEDTDDSTSETIGYGRPPLHTRFKPGQSGNPKGRPKHRKNISTVVSEVLNERIKIREGNKIKSMSKSEAIARSMVLRALKGDTKSFTSVMDLDEKIRQEQKQKSIPTRVVRMPAKVNSIEEWLEQYAPKDIVEARKMERGTSEHQT